MSEAHGAIALVLARGGSKGLPGKNIRPLGGHPLIAWSVAAGLAAARVDRVICSTDDPEIAATARAYGAETPFLRPAEFARDQSTDLEVFRHALGWLSEHEGVAPERIVQLRPTTPFREPRWIDAALSRMEADPSITCARSVCEAPHPPYKMWRRREDGDLEPLLTLPGVAEPFNMPRQSLPRAWWHTGQLDVVRCDAIMGDPGSMTGGRIVAIDVARDLAVDIDGLEDFLFAEVMLPRVRDRLAIPRRVG